MTVLEQSGQMERMTSKERERAAVMAELKAAITNDAEYVQCKKYGAGIAKREVAKAVAAIRTEESRASDRLQNFQNRK